MKATDKVRKNKIEIASENLFGEHIEPSGTAGADTVIILLSLSALAVAWWLT